MAGGVGIADLMRFLDANREASPLVYSSNDPEKVRAVQARYGRDDVARRLDGLFAETARALVAGSVRRLVVAGGETSGAVAQALDLEALEIAPEIDPGVPILKDTRDTVALALKSGNFGAADFFSKALNALKGNR